MNTSLLIDGNISYNYKKIVTFIGINIENLSRLETTENQNLLTGERLRKSKNRSMKCLLITLREEKEIIKPPAE